MMFHRRKGNGGIVCYLLAYREPGYVRTRTILASLRRHPAIKTVTAINRSRDWRRYFEMLFQLIILRIREDPRYYILGFRGHEIFFLVRLLTWGRVLIFDAMMSPYGALQEEGHYGPLGRWLAKGVRIHERWIFRASDGIWTDTMRHRQWMMATFGVPGEKIIGIPVGAEESWPQPQAIPAHEMFQVLFYGTFLPLHGVSFIFEAARLLRHHRIRFTIIGGRADQRAWIQQSVALGEGCIEHHHFVPFDELLGNYIPKADLCLGGPFGQTPQASRIINGKTQQFLAMGKAVVVSHTDPADGFIDRVNCLIVPPADSQSLAEAILWAMDHPQELANIAAAGRHLYTQAFSVARIGEIIHPLFGGA
ncbi:MAG: glycosyltransferase [Nitrospirae bacterium]|nr:glycosyltransferase [Magnetococcales bacterium]